MADGLSEAGFNVGLVSDLSRDDLLEELAEFQDLPAVEVSAIYFVGLGASHENRKYIAPNEYEFDGVNFDEAARGSLISVSRIYSSHPGSELNINIINAALQDPSASGANSIGTNGDGIKGLVAVKDDDENFFSGAGSGIETIYLFSAQPGEPSFDTVVFAESLTHALTKPGDLIRAFAQVRDQVALRSNLAQFPDIRLQAIGNRPTCLAECKVDGLLQSDSLAAQLKRLEAGECTGDFTHEGLGDNRVALLVGNNGYRTRAWSNLSEPANDARLVASALKSSGFQVRICTNLGLEKLEEEVERFQSLFDDLTEQHDAAGPPPAALFYFSGHGAADPVNNVNYLIPTDSNAESAGTLRGEAFSIDRLADGFDASEGQIMLVIDACRNALKIGTTQDGAKGLLPFQRRPNILLASATQPGEVAWQTSGYAKFLADRIRQSGERYESEVAFVFRDVGEQVYNETEGKQQPITEGALRGRFFFRN